MTENEISYEIRECIFKVYNNLGTGLLESAYKTVLDYEFKKKGLEFGMEIYLPINYEDKIIDAGYRIDLLVENKVIVELKSVETLLKVHHLQVLTY
jgi:GxxExxY protein